MPQVETTANAVEGRHSDTVALVTGSTRGIGEAVARRFAAEGASVVVTGRSADAGQEVAQEIRDAAGEATFVRADMRSPDDVRTLVDATVEEYGRIDVLVNNAGVQTETTAGDATMDDWEFVVETDFRSFWLCVKYAIEHIPAGGTVLNMSSNHAFVTEPGLFPYNAIKAGINGMTRAIAIELGPLDARIIVTSQTDCSGGSVSISTTSRTRIRRSSLSTADSPNTDTGTFLPILPPIRGVALTEAIPCTSSRSAERFDTHSISR